MAAENDGFEPLALDPAKRVLHEGVNAVRIGDGLVEVSAVNADGIAKIVTVDQSSFDNTRIRGAIARSFAGRQQRTLGQIAYEAYLKSSDGISLVTGVIPPPWSEQLVPICAAWESAARAVLEESPSVDQSR